jgi:hypothetical protein
MSVSTQSGCFMMYASKCIAVLLKRWGAANTYCIVVDRFGKTTTAVRCGNTRKIGNAPRELYISGLLILSSASKLRTATYCIDILQCCQYGGPTVRETKCRLPACRVADVRLFTSLVLLECPEWPIEPYRLEARENVRSADEVDVEVCSYRTESILPHHFHQKTEQDPSSFSERLIDRSPGEACFRPKGSVIRNDNRSQIGPISSFDTAIEGLSKSG